jgi:hypothetical protein
MLWSISGAQREEEAGGGGGWRRLHNEELHKLYPSPNILLLLSSFLGFTAQLRPWPPPQNPAEFLGGF